MPPSETDIELVGLLYEQLRLFDMPDARSITIDDGDTGHHVARRTVKATD